ncbi:MAG TPA: hypothetical protein VK982_05625 [Bacteroidales bacterium]|nr:hypothetical protein [Bacteroidales bacterium]
MGKIRKNCEVCGRFYYRKPYNADSAKYCSNKCRYEGTRTKKEVICDGCGKTMMRSPSLCKQNDKNYCTPECYHEDKKKGEYRNCGRCGKEFYVSKSAIEKDTPRGGFCSRKCFYKNRNIYPNTLELRKKVLEKWNRENISDYYVRSLLYRTADLDREDIPKELIELKRLNIKRKRKLKTLNKK